MEISVLGTRVLCLLFSNIVCRFSSVKKKIVKSYDNKDSDKYSLADLFRCDEQIGFWTLVEFSYVTVLAMSAVVQLKLVWKLELHAIVKLTLILLLFLLRSAWSNH